MEDITQFDCYGLTLCPDCKHSMYCAESGNRDTETMGGHSVEYFHCDNCNQEYELIWGIEGKKLYPA